LFNFNADIYGRYVEVHFKQKIRDEMSFPSLPALQAQIENDIEISKAFFASRYT
jgi:riboflavin kinase/FMN adenylyltransferase